MGTAVKEPPKQVGGIYSGFCGLRLDARSHARCAGAYAGRPCACACHHTCPTCGQQVPAAAARGATT